MQSLREQGEKLSATRYEDFLAELQSDVELELELHERRSHHARQALKRIHEHTTGLTDSMYRQLLQDLTDSLSREMGQIDWSQEEDYED